jgi:hypothetical protein
MTFIHFVYHCLVAEGTLVARFHNKLLTSLHSLLRLPSSQARCDLKSKDIKADIYLMK